MIEMIQPEAVRALYRAYKDDTEVEGIIADALKSFEEYHASIYTLEMQKLRYACGVMDDGEYRELIPLLDKKRTSCHNLVLSNVTILNRLAAQAGLPPLYDGTVSEERPYRRQVANAVLACVGQIIKDRS